MNLGFAMAFSPLAFGSVRQEAAHGGTDYWCRDRLLVSVLFSAKKELTPIIRPNNPKKTFDRAIAIHRRA
jgi:hypothetical protein